MPDYLCSIVLRRPVVRNQPPAHRHEGAHGHDDVSAMRRAAAGVVGAAVLWLGLLGSGAAGAEPSGNAAIPPFAVHVRGNTLVDGRGRAIRLLGVDRSGTEYMCLSGGGIFDGPVGAAAIAAIRAWHANVVRIPLNEDCWLGINLGAGNPDQGAPYRNAILRFVSRLNAAGLYAILDLHWNAPGKNLANAQQPMADADHAPAFWSSVAAAFKDRPAVIFDLYNEPYVESWRCWRDGCTVTTGAQPWRTAGMTALVAAVRKAGATQPIMLGGLAYASDLGRWLAYAPDDPLRSAATNPVRGQAQLVAGYHSYCGPPGTGTPAACRSWLVATKAQWPAVTRVAKTVPVVTGELGEYDCATTYVAPFMKFADQGRLSYLGWAWDTYDCGGFPALIADYSGTPTRYGIGLMRHLAALAR